MAIFVMSHRRHNGKHDAVIKWKHFPPNWPFVRGIHRSRWIPRTKASTRSFDIFFDLRLNKRLSKQPWGWWFETPSWSLWRQCNDCEEITRVPFLLKWSYYHETMTCIVWYSVFVTRNGWCSIVRMITPIRYLLVQYSRQSSNIVNWLSCSMHARMSASCRDDLRSTHARVVTSWREVFM